MLPAGLWCRPRRPRSPRFSANCRPRGTISRLAWCWIGGTSRLHLPVRARLCPKCACSCSRRTVTTTHPRLVLDSSHSGPPSQPCPCLCRSHCPHPRIDPLHARTRLGRAAGTEQTCCTTHPSSQPTARRPRLSSSQSPPQLRPVPRRQLHTHHHPYSPIQSGWRWLSSPLSRHVQLRAQLQAQRRRNDYQQPLLRLASHHSP